ncbi:MAG: tRNA lysidine(34) synthetase TilS [Alphaproteobacteria bacterium]|nr:tRNA lysidine(34) synthetase TilS [Alphaproteobacteria bacterium]
MAASPLTAEFTAADFAAALEPLLPAGAPPALAVACSGGSDSLALALLARDWAAARGVRLIALVVDHGLRPDSAREAETVRSRLADCGVEALVLRDPAWPGPVPGDGGVQAAARTLRYRLLLAACRAQDTPVLALAHHLEDQAETVLLRLARGSGVDGLSAMAPAVEWGGVRLVRPLLDAPKASLRATVRAAGMDWVEDPFNRDPRFERARLRAAAPTLEALGLDARALSRTARRMARARDALERATDDLLAGAAQWRREGYALIDAAALAAAPEEAALRALSRIICRTGGRLHPPRLDRLERLHAALVGSGGLGAGRTLAGVALRPRRDGRLLIHREPAAARERVPVAADLLWDGRFRLRFEAPDPAFEVRALGRDGWSQLRRADPAAGAAGAALPGPVRLALPAVWRTGPRSGETAVLVGAPHLQGARALVDGAPAPRSVVFAGPRAV